MERSGASSLDSNGSNESIAHSFVSSERHNNPQIPPPPIPIEYDVVTTNQCYDKQNYTAKGGAHGMSASYCGPETLQQQCDAALLDLGQLRRAHQETTRRHDHAMKELEYFRSQHRAAMSQLEASAQEASSLRGQYSDLLNDNQRLEREVQHLHEAAGGEGEQYELQKR
ncbi:unnamed protein product [Plutella xylostella]|nr:unnamed protein product [Plutella xylostella]